MTFRRSIGPADVTWLSLLIVGEGWHNFHHIFPWDYRSTDIGLYACNLATMFIDLMAKIGWAYDLKVVPDHVIRRRAARTGDGSHPFALPENTGAHTEQDKYVENCLNDSQGAKTTNIEEIDLVSNLTKSKDINKNIRDVPIDKLDVGEIGPAPWGWGDSDIPEEDTTETIITHCHGSKAK